MATDQSKDETPGQWAELPPAEVERRAMEAARRMLTTPKLKKAAPQAELGTSDAAEEVPAPLRLIMDENTRAVADLPGKLLVQVHLHPLHADPAEEGMPRARRDEFGAATARPQRTDGPPQSGG